MARPRSRKSVDHFVAPRGAPLPLMREQDTLPLGEQIEITTEARAGLSAARTRTRVRNGAEKRGPMTMKPRGRARQKGGDKRIGAASPRRNHPRRRRSNSRCASCTTRRNPWRCASAAAKLAASLLPKRAAADEAPSRRRAAGGGRKPSRCPTSNSPAASPIFWRCRHDELTARRAHGPRLGCGEKGNAHGQYGLGGISEADNGQS